MLKVRELVSYTWIKNENNNRGDDKALVQESKIPYISDMQKYNPVTSPKSTSELMKELNYVFTAYESGHFRVRNHSSALIPKPPPANPAGVKKLQVTYFNGERGSFWLKQCEIFKNDPMLNGSDVIFFNELDIGMARSGNFDTVNMLATCISMNYVYAVECIECIRWYNGAHSRICGCHRFAEIIRSLLYYNSFEIQRNLINYNYDLYACTWRIFA
jgi:hypothetical protein